jgi:hypothetical protein
MATKEAQINLRLPAELDAWLEVQAGGSRGKPAYIRELLERQRAKEEEETLRTIFNSGWDSLSDSERKEVVAEREALLGGFSSGQA